MDALDAYRRILPWMQQRIDATQPDQFGLPTPCSEWDVRSLLFHVFATVRYYAHLAQRVPFDSGDFSEIGIDEVHHPEAFRLAAADALRAWETPGSLERDCGHPIGGPMSGVFALSIHAADTLVHGWDLAMATGQDTQMDEDSAAFALRTFQKVLAKDLSRGRLFAPALSIPGPASPQATLLALIGRSPDWDKPSRSGLEPTATSPTNELEQGAPDGNRCSAKSGHRSRQQG